MCSRLAGALAGHFHQAQCRHLGDLGLGVVLFQIALQRGQHLFLVLVALHVDEIDDDDAAQIAQPQLAGNGLRRFQIGFENGFFQIAAADVAAGVDVDSRHRFGLVEHQMAAGFEFDLAVQRLADLVLDVVNVEHRPLAGIVFDDRDDFRHEGFGEFDQL